MEVQNELFEYDYMNVHDNYIYFYKKFMCIPVTEELEKEIIPL